MDPKSAHKSYRKLSEPSHTRPVILLVLVFGISAILLVVSLFLILTQVVSLYSPTKYDSSETTVNHPTPTQSQVDQSLDTSTWKTYTNKKYNYSIKYPPEWKLSEEENFTYDDELSLRILTPPNNDDVYIFIGIDSNPENLSITEFLRKKRFISVDLFEFSSTKLDNVDGLKYDIPTDYPQQNFVFKKEGYLYMIGLVGEPKTTINQILSTFKFTN